MEQETNWALLDKLECAVHDGRPRKVREEAKLGLLQSIYRQMDLRKTGQISKQDLGSLLRKVDPTITTQRVTALLKKISYDGDDVVTFDEFVQFYTKFEEEGRMNDEQADLVKATFRAWDMDQSGKLSKREFFSVMKSLNRSMTDTKITLLYTAMDRDHDGKISYDEWIDFMFKPDA